MTQASARIGIDVGGTNTDAVILVGTEVLASTKVPTTKDIQSGVAKAAAAVMEEAGLSVEHIQEVMIGTTQFTNAFIERKKLTPICSIRIALPATTSVRPFTDWPEDLAAMIGQHSFLVGGGHEFDGRKIAELDEGEVARIAKAAAQKGISEFAITSVFSPVDKFFEERAAAVVLANCPQANITLSSEVGRLGLIERENASNMNASLIAFANDVISGFKQALEHLQIQAPFYISQNDGTLMNEDYIRRYPVLTFASGPTNSMRGAAYLTKLQNAIVVDIGGTTTDVGVLINGFPRESSIPVDIGGVRTNFRMPDIISIGLGGGSIVRSTEDGEIKIGPDSVGYELTEKALVFGGDVLTTTDIIVAAGRCEIGDPKLVSHLDKDVVDAAEAEIHRMIETIVDRVKTSKSDMPVILVGGGSVLVSRPLRGASEVIAPSNSGVANAIGAAKSQIGSEIDKIFSYTELGREPSIELAKTQASQSCEAAGAEPDSIEIVDVDEIPLSYLPGGAVRIRVKAVGDLRR
tara:strand:- start:6130 stop:7692 length:1563 start_codon:yes stop_codon:yes gene_type:complete